MMMINNGKNPYDLTRLWSSLFECEIEKDATSKCRHYISSSVNISLATQPGVSNNDVIPSGGIILKQFFLPAQRNFIKIGFHLSPLFGNLYG